MVLLHKVTQVHLYEYALRVLHTFLYTYRCFYLICICMPILYMPIHYMQGVGGGGWGGKGQKVKRLYTIYVFPFEGCILYIYIYIHSINAFEGCMHICSVVRK